MSDQDLFAGMRSRGLGLHANLHRFWEAEELMFVRHVPETGKTVLLIEQIFNIKLAVASTFHWKLGHDDGY